MIRKFLSVAFLLVLATPLSAQETPTEAKKSEQKAIETDGRSCELNIVHLLQLTQAASSNNARIFVISRPGIRETLPRLSHRRLFNVRTWFELKRRFDPANMILAEGEKVKGPGRLEFYLGSELFIVATFQKNGDFCVSCCWMPGDPRVYFPEYRGKQKHRIK